MRTHVRLKHSGRNSFPWDPGREIALITTVAPPKWRQRATAGGEELGFKQYRVQEVQPSLLVVDSDISSNEHLGALPACPSMNRYHTWCRALRAVIVPVSLCELVSCTLLCAPERPRALLPFTVQMWVICRITGRPKWPGLTGAINQSVVGALGRDRGVTLRLHLQVLELHRDPEQQHTVIFKWSMAGWTAFISSKEANTRMAPAMC